MGGGALRTGLKLYISTIMETYPCESDLADHALILSASVLTGHLEISTFWQNYDIFRNSFYFKKGYFIHVVIEQIIIFVAQLIVFLPRDKDRCPHSVKSPKRTRHST